MRDFSGFYTCPTGHGLLESLAHHLSEACASDPNSLSQKVILLPTRRCGRLLKHHFQKKIASSFFMPQVFTFGDLSSQGIGFLRALGVSITPFDRTLLTSNPPPINPLRAHLLVSAWLKNHAAQNKDSKSLSSTPSLGNLLLSTYATLQERGLSLSHVASHIPDMHALHWAHYTSLLEEFWTFWPQCLEDQSYSDPGCYKKKQLESLSLILTKKPPSSQVYIIAPKGLSLALAELFATLSRQNNVLILFEGDLDELQPSSKTTDPSFPYREQQDFLKSLSVSVPSLQNWAPAGALASSLFDTQLALKKYLSLNTLPPHPLNRTQSPITYWEAETLQEEAQFIALKLKKASTQNKTAVLITPDRHLVQRVTQELLYFGIVPDDSYGIPLNQTLFGQLLMLSWECFSHKFSAPYLQALLHHPLCSFGMDPDNFSKAQGLLEKNFLRGLAMIPGLNSLKRRVQTASDSMTISRADLSLLLDFLGRLEEAFLPLLPLQDDQNFEPMSLISVHDLHMEVMDALMKPAPEITSTEHFDTLEALMTPLQSLLKNLPLFSITSYGECLQSYLASTTEPPTPTHPAISILGILEGRLISADYVILGGLNENSWDGALSPNPWLNQNLREALSLDTNKTVQCQIFQEFLSHLCHPEVCLTRSKRSPTSIEKPSRFFLQAKIKGEPNYLISEDKEGYLTPKLHACPCPYKSRPPAPSPPLSLRPTTLHVTHMATLAHNPYGFYVRSILKLHPLRRFEEPPSAQDFGIWIHKILENALKKQCLSPQKMLEAFERTYPFRDLPSPTRFFLKERIKSILKAFEITNQRHLASMGPASIFGEVPVEHIYGPRSTDTRSSLILKGRVDRLEKRTSDLSPSGVVKNLHLIDYKTGALPTPKEIFSMKSPQMTLLALLLEHKMNPLPRDSLGASFWALDPGSNALIPIKNLSLAMDQTEPLFLDLLESYYGHQPRAYGATKTPHDPFPTLSRQQEWSGILSHFFHEES